MNDSRLVQILYRSTVSVVLATFAILAGAVSQVQAQVEINSTFSSDGSVYTYLFRITNNSASSLALVTAEIPLALDDVAGITSPQGFFAAFDPAFDTFDMLEDADPFTTETFAPGTTVGNFTFTSANRIAPATFTAILDDGNFTPVTGNVSIVAVPELGTIALFGAGFVALGGLATRRRKFVIR
jgi:hypothetical protein